MSYDQLRKLEGKKPLVGIQGLKQTVRVNIRSPGLAVSLEFNLIIAPAPDAILHKMIWEIQQELSRRGAKAA